MALVACVECGAQISDSVAACPRCGISAERAHAVVAQRAAASAAQRERSLSARLGRAWRGLSQPTRFGVIGGGVILAVSSVVAVDLLADARDREITEANKRLVAAEAVSANAAASAAHQRALQDAQAAQTRIDAAWAAYDALPVKSKAALIATVQRTNDDARTLPSPTDAAAKDANMSNARKRMAPLFEPETTAEGDGNATLVPSLNAAKCTLWSSMWTKDDDTLAALVSLGFKSVRCGAGKPIDLVDLSRTCFLYNDSSDEPVFVWKTLEFFRKGIEVGAQTGEEAEMRMLAIVSAGAATMMPGGHFVVKQVGPGWTEVSGVDKQAGISGYVADGLCHHKPYKAR